MLGTSKSIWGFDPRSIPGCAIWLDGNDPTTFTPAAPSAGTTITAWRDKASGFSFTPGAINVQSSNGTVLTPVGPTYVAGGGAFFSNATQAIGNNEQALGIYQAGVTTPLFFVPTQSMTMIIASSATSNDTLRRIAQIGTYPSTANPNFLLGPQMGVSEGGSVIFDVGPAQLNYSTSTATYSTAIGLRVDTMISAPGATQWWWTNGTLNTFTNSNIYTSTRTNYPVNFFFLGAYTNTVDGNRCYLGNIYEVLFYSNALTTSQRRTVEGYLANKWGFKASLVTTNPFRSYPPLVRSFSPVDIPNCSLWLDGADNSTMNSTTTVTLWSDKSGLGNNMAGTATWTGSNLTFNGSTQAFSNTWYVFPNSAFSMFAVYSNTTAPASTAYMNAVYGSNGYPMLGVYGSNKSVSARSVVANTGALRGAVLWAAQIASISPDRGSAIATDSSGNVFVTGYYSATLLVANQGPSGTTATTLPWTGDTDAFVAKYSSAGAVLWAARIAGTTTSSDIGNGIATDPSGNVFVTGQYGDALTLYNQGPSGTAGTTLPWTGNTDAFVAKYSSTGAVVWAARIAGALTDSGYAIATDSSGNVFVTGQYGAALTVYNQGPSGTSGATLPFTGGNDCFVAKYSSAGAVVWAAQITGTTTSGDYGSAIATDSSGNVFVTGYYGAALTLYNQGGTAGTTLPFTSGTNDCFVAKYSSAGAVLWAAQISSTGSDIGNGIATDSSGNVFVTGSYSAALTLYNQGPSGTAGTTLPFTGGNDCFVAKYSSAGAVVWAAQIASTTTRNDIGNGIATDPSGNVFVIGHLGGALTLYNTGGTVGTTLPYISGPDVFIAKYNADGYINAIPASSNVLVSATKEGQTFSPFANGFAATTLAGNTSATTGIYVGGPSNYFNGSISELLIYSATLSVAQRQQVEGYLTNKWRLNSQIVTGHPYKLIPPASVLPFFPTSITGCAIWLDGADNSSMNSTTTVTAWSDKSGLGNNMVGTATWSGSNLTFNGSTHAFSNTGYVFPNSAYSMFAVYSNTTAPASTAYMNAIYGNGGYPMLGVYGSNKSVSARSVVANTGALGVTVGWAAQIAGTTTSSDIGYGIAAGSNGNVLVTGQYGAALTLYNQGGTVGTTLPFTGSIDCFVANYSSNGTVSWAAQIASTGAVNDIGYGIATDSSGNVFVTGYYSAALTLYNTGGGTGATLPFTGGADCFVAKYSSAGAVVWAAQITGTTTSSDIGFGIATDSSGNVLVTGNYGAALTLYNTGGGTGATLPFTGGADCFVAKYSSAGAVVWAAQITGTTTSYDQGYGIATDSSGNVFVTGYYSAALTVYNQGGTAGTTLPFTGGQDCFIAKYSSAGAVVWAARIAGTGFDVGQGIITDSSGNVLVTGWYGAALTFYNQDGTAGITLPFTGGNDCFVAKYNPDGYITAPVPASSNVLVSATYTSATLSPFVNGSNASTLAGTTLAATGIFVGGPLNYFNGSISELLVYSNTLTTVQRQQVEGYLARKWGIALPVTHPYSKFGPALA